MCLQLRISCLCVALMLPGVAQAEFDEKQLQSLFMTVSQREQVDNIRNGTEKSAISEQPARIEKSEKITVTGFVKRSNGKNVVWLNGKNTMERDSISDIQVKTNSINSSNEVIVIVDGKQQRLKPGESWLRPSAVEAASESP